MIMENMGDFNQGWWNCFDSITAEMSMADGPILKNVLCSAGVTAEEIDYVIEHEIVRNDLIPFLLNYRYNL